MAYIRLDNLYCSTKPDKGETELENDYIVIFKVLAYFNRFLQKYTLFSNPQYGFLPSRSYDQVFCNTYLYI